MRRLLSNRVERPAVAGRAWLLYGWALIALGMAAPLAAQQDQDTATQDTFDVAEAASDSVIGAAVSVGDDDAALELQLSNGRTVELELEDGQIRVDGESIGDYEEGGALENSWRALLEEAAMASTGDLPAVLRDWSAPAAAGVVGRQLDQALDQALAGVGGRASSRSFGSVDSPEDSIEELLAHIEDLEEQHASNDFDFDDDRSPAERFAEDVVEGLIAFFATLVWIGVLLAVGAALLFFATGRLERVAQTVRDEPLRSGLIGLAGAFLAIPFYVLVILALAISILGIPLIIAWAPLFPLLFVLAGLAGWLAVAYSAGDAMVRSKLETRPAFTNASQFKRLAVGVTLLLSPFLFASIFRMTSVLEWVGGLLFGLGLMGNLLVAAVGFGAVLARGRDSLELQRERRAAARRAKLETATVVQENTNV